MMLAKSLYSILAAKFHRQNARSELFIRSDSLLFSVIFQQIITGEVFMVGTCINTASRWFGLNFTGRCVLRNPRCSWRSGWWIGEVNEFLGQGKICLFEHVVLALHLFDTFANFMSHEWNGELSPSSTIFQRSFNDRPLKPRFSLAHLMFCK